MRPAPAFRIAVLLALGFQAMPLPAQQTAADVLARSKDAHGGAAWDAVQTLAFAATFFLDGRDDPIPGEVWEDLPNGRYLRCVGTGEDLRWWSFDGSRFWLQPGTGVPTAVSGRLRDQVARACAYMHARGYWYPDRFPAAATYLGLAEEGGASCHVLRLEPRDALPLECRVDAGTWRIRRISWALERGTWCHAFLDYRPTRGLLLPYLIRCGWEGSEAQTRILVHTYRLREGLPEGAYRCWEKGVALVKGHQN